MKKTIYYFFPDRFTLEQNEFLKQYWDVHQAAAARLDVNWVLARPDSFTAKISSAGTSLYYQGTEVKKENTVFVAYPYGTPESLPDSWQQFLFINQLEEMNFYNPMVLKTCLTTNDKFSTYQFLSGMGINFLPTYRIQTSRNIEFLEEKNLETLFEFPVIAKPASWGARIGIQVANNPRELKRILLLASVTNPAYVIQKYLGENFCDYRIFCIEGRPFAYSRTITPYDSLFAKKHHDGVGVPYEGKLLTFQRGCPNELKEISTKIANKFNLKYICVDFLYDGKSYYFSEVEPDGSYYCRANREVTIDILEARYNAYLNGLKERYHL